jgi:hypothetical protein
LRDMSTHMEMEKGSHMDGVLLELEGFSFYSRLQRGYSFSCCCCTQSRSEEKSRVLYSRFKEHCRINPTLLSSPSSFPALMIHPAMYRVTVCHLYPLRNMFCRGCLTCHGRIVVFGAVFGNISRQLSRTILGTGVNAMGS